MATTLSAKLKAEFNILSYGKADDLNTPAEALNLSNSTTYSFGLGDSKAEVIYRTRTSVTPATFIEFDIYGTLVDIFGDTVSIEILRGIYVHNRNSVSGDKVTVRPATGGNALLTPFGDANGKVVVGPGGTFFLDCPVDGYAVAANADIIEITNDGSNTVEIDIALLGNSGDFVSSSSSSSSSPASVSSSSSSSSTVQASWSSSSSSKSVSSSSSSTASSQSSSSTSSSTVQQSGSSSSSTSSSST